MGALIAILLWIAFIRFLINKDRQRLINLTRPKCPPHKWGDLGNKLKCEKCGLSPFEGKLDAQGPDYDN